MARHTGTDDDFLSMALIGYEPQIAKIVAAIADIQAKLGHRGPGRPRVAVVGSSKASYERRCTQADWGCTTQAMGGLSEGWWEEGEGCSRKRIVIPGRSTVADAAEWL